MSGLREFLERSLVQMALGALILLLAINAFASGGSRIIIGLLLAFTGGRSVWRGFTKWQAEHN